MASILALFASDLGPLFAPLRVAALFGEIEMSHVLIALGAFAGGFISGLTGFGTGLTAMPFWLYATTPIIAAQLAVAGAALGHVQTIRAIFPVKNWGHIAPVVVAGLVGVPIGITLLPLIPPRAFKIGIGVFLILFCGFLLIARGRWLLTKRRRIGDILAGFGGGFTAGLAGLPGPAPIVWATIHDWSREEKRALFQVFNLVIATMMLTASAVTGLMTVDFLIALAIAVPGTVLGAHAGVETYRRIDARGFDRIVLAMLIVSGVTLVYSNI